MKRQIRKLVGLPSLALIAIASLLMASQALADYTGSCAASPATVTGNATIGTAGTACIIPAAGVNATGLITVLGSTITTTGPLTANGGALTITGSSTINVKALRGTSIAVTAPAAITTTTLTSTTGNIDVTSTGVMTTTVISSAQHVDLNSQGSTGDVKVTGALTATSGYVQVRAGRLVKVTGAVKSLANGNMLITAKTTLATGAVTGAPGYNVDLKANVAGGTSAFVINPATGTPTNGVKGKITASNGSTVYVTNGSSSSASNITLTTNTGIAVNGTVSNRYIILNANMGTINMPAGVLSIDGTGTNSAGQIQLLAKTVAFANDAGLSAKQSASAPGSLHGVAISADTVTYGGATTGLTITADGNGNNPNAAFVYLIPQGATTITDGQDINNLFIGVANNLFGNSTSTMTYQGAAGSPLTVSANGDNSIVGVYAYSTSFSSGGTASFQAKGTFSHLIYFQTIGTFTARTSLNFGNTGDLTFDATGTTGDGGTINIYADKMSVTPSTISLKADGPTAASTNGGGGTIFFFSSALTTVANPTVTFSANAASSGTGSASASNGITFYPNSTATLALGTGTGKYSFSAKGGSSGGNGGAVNIYAWSNPIAFNTSRSIDTSAPGPTGDAGTITVNASTFSVAAAGGSIAADGGTTSGSGGQIHLFGGGTYSVGSTGNAVLLSAKAAGTGNTTSSTAGTIEIANAQALTADGSGMLLNTSGNANGGAINVHDIVSLTVTGTVAADGKGNGSGGSLTLQSPYLNDMILNNATLSASVDASGSGKGGALSITNAGTVLMQGAVLNANAAGTGDAGNVTLQITGAGSTPINVGQANFNAYSGSGSGKGGTISINKATGLNSSTPIDITSSFKVSAGTSANSSVFDGSVSLNINADGDPIVCQQFKNTTTAWPSIYWYCGYNPPDALVVLNDLQALSSQSVASLANANPVYVLVFKNNLDVQAFLASTEVDEIDAPTGSVAGWFNPSENRIIVLEGLTFGGVFLYLPAADVAETARHESAHVLDFVWGALAGRSWVSQIGGNQQQSYNGFIQHDFRNLTFQAPGYTVQMPACGTGAMFQGRLDPRTGMAICPLSGDLVGLNNQQILQTILPYFMTVNVSQQRWLEAWAQEYAAFSGASGTATADTYFRSYFPCSQIFVNSLIMTGALAPLSAYPATCTN